MGLQLLWRGSNIISVTIILQSRGPARFRECMGWSPRQHAIAWRLDAGRRWL